MPTTTSLLDIPLPEATDAPNGPAQMLAMAERLETVVPRTELAAGNLTTSSASLVDITGGALTVTTASGTAVEITAQCLISPSGAGDAKVNLSIDGVDYGQIAQVNSGGAASTQRWLQPGSTTGNALAGAWVTALLQPGSKIIKLRGLSTSGSASFVGLLYVRIYKVGLPT